MALVSLSTRDHIATIRLERPEAMNAVSGAMADDIAQCFREVSADESVWVVVLAAAGEKAFCVGADLKERAAFSLEDFYRNRAQIRGLFEAVRNTPQPVIAAPFGFALGGGFELVLSADLVVASKDVQFGLPEARVGLLPAGGGTQLLTRKVGTSRAKELIFLGKRIDAEYALRSGLVAEVCERKDLEETVEAFARDLARSSPVAVRAAKRAIDGALGLPIDEGIELENDAWQEVISSADRLEGIKAFTEKRDPEWQNR